MNFLWISGVSERPTGQFAAQLSPVWVSGIRGAICRAIVVSRAAGSLNFWWIVPRPLRPLRISDEFSLDFWLVVGWIFRLDFLGRLGAADFEGENRFVLTSELKNSGGCPRHGFRLSFRRFPSAARFGRNLCDSLPPRVSAGIFAIPSAARLGRKCTDSPPERISFELPLHLPRVSSEVLAIPSAAAFRTRFRRFPAPRVSLRMSAIPSAATFRTKSLRFPAPRVSLRMSAIPVLRLFRTKYRRFPAP